MWLNETKITTCLRRMRPLLACIVVGFLVRPAAGQSLGLSYNHARVIFYDAEDRQQRVLEHDWSMGANEEEILLPVFLNNIPWPYPDEFFFSFDPTSLVTETVLEYPHTFCLYYENTGFQLSDDFVRVVAGFENEPLFIPPNLKLVHSHADCIFIDGIPSPSAAGPFTGDVVGFTELWGSPIFEWGFNASVRRISPSNPSQIESHSSLGWSPAGQGFNSPGVRALATYDDGTGESLYAGGEFTIADGQPANYIARWDGTAWTPVASPFDGPVRALSVFDDGGGAALFAGGDFTQAGGAPDNFLARWDGTRWSGLDAPVDAVVRALMVWNDGSGLALYVGADSGIYRWDGTSWSDIGAGAGAAKAFEVFDDGSGEALHVIINNGGVAKWDGANSWSWLNGLPNFATIYALEVFDDGSGPALYTGGRFNGSGGITRWNGTAWSPPMGSEMFTQYPVRSLIALDEGPSCCLYAGWQGGTARWDGTDFSLAGIEGATGEVFALHSPPNAERPMFWAGGHFTYTSGLLTNHIAAFDPDAAGPFWQGEAALIVADFATDRLALHEPRIVTALQEGRIVVVNAAVFDQLVVNLGVAPGDLRQYLMNDLVGIETGCGYGPADPFSLTYVDIASGRLIDGSFASQYPGMGWFKILIFLEIIPVAEYRDVARAINLLAASLICPWDLDADGSVGITDFLQLLSLWGTDPGGPPDFDGDGDVGITDFLELLANWGPCP